jgi:hypothetical protein
MLLENVRTDLYLYSLQFLIITRCFYFVVWTGLGLCYRMYIIFSEPLVICLKCGHVPFTKLPNQVDRKAPFMQSRSAYAVNCNFRFCVWDTSVWIDCVKYRAHSTAVRQAETRSWPLAVSFAEVTNEWNCTTTPPHALMACRRSAFLHLLSKCMRI